MADFEAIYLEHFQNVCKYIFSLCRNESVAEEMTQEAFCKAMEHIDRFSGTCSLYVWLCQIAKNTYFTYAKRQRRQAPEAEIELSQPALSFEADFFDREAAKLLRTLLSELKEPYKEVFSLRVFGELPFSRIGELFGKTDSWARVIFCRAKKQLRRRFDACTM